ncbi:hypothetical protein [Myceligenerans xiligouense]|uniref:Permease n=1 Tax=Myceligenerans xiligouense TaxID=253184 RepID=A0A3N4Z3X4_9MICO|nr:hypothetical protein [Myceligenerans xiligouense]RPF19872.1 hypothetical protein EDD34_0438 [Myceligenerans xiligouense]
MSDGNAAPGAAEGKEGAGVGADGPAGASSSDNVWLDWRGWIKRVIVAVALVVVVWLVYQFLAAFLPRWWAQTIGDAVDGSFAAGAWWGFLIGLVFTAGPVVLLLLAAWPGPRSAPVRTGLVVLAILCAAPNLLTMAVVLGSSNAAHAGERIMDVDAPAFRGASLAGALTGGILALALTGLIAWFRLRGRRLKELQARGAGPAR